MCDVDDVDVDDDEWIKKFTAKVASVVGRGFARNCGNPLDGSDF